MRFTPCYREKVVLDDGCAVELRLIRSDDKNRLRQVLAGLSIQSRRLRFFVARGDYAESELRYLSEIDGHDHFAIIATRGDESLGVARFVRLKGSGSVAEPAFAVIDQYQRRGLGQILIDRLAVAARERGISRFEVEVLPDNHGMLRLLRKRGASIPTGGPSYESIVCSLDLAATEWPWPARVHGAA